MLHSYLSLVFLSVLSSAYAVLLSGGRIDSRIASPVISQHARSRLCKMVAAETVESAGRLSAAERHASRFQGFCGEEEFFDGAQLQLGEDGLKFVTVDDSIPTTAGVDGEDEFDFVDFSMDDMDEQMKHMIAVSRGETVTGTVIGLPPDGALIEIGVKSSAFCPLLELGMVKPAKPEDVLEIGEQQEFMVISREDENGRLLLSRRRIQFIESWQKVFDLYTDGVSVEAEVAAVNKGGAMIMVEGLRGFLPGSHYLPGQNPPETLVGQKLTVKFLDVDKETSRIVVSHRKALVDMTINKLHVGSVMSGVITAVKPYGAFVDVGGMSGLLHISQISCDHISDVGSVLPVGTAIKCMVISQDKNKGRVALSTKTLEAEPGLILRDREAVFEKAEETAAKYQERIEAERKAREEAAQDVIFGLESVFAEPMGAEVPAVSANFDFSEPADTDASTDKVDATD